MKNSSGRAGRARRSGEGRLARFLVLVVALACVLRAAIPSAEAAQEFGTYLGQFRTVEARSSYRSSYPTNFINHSLYGENVRTGLKWECVEYMRRFYLSALNLHITTGGHGWEWFGLAPNIVYMDGTTRRVGFDRFDDSTATRPPAVGDILAYDTSVNEHGHVAIIKRVRPGYIRTAQQNWLNESSDLDRRLPLTSDNGRYDVNDPGVQGWLRPRCEARQSNSKWHPDGTLLVEPGGAVWLIEYDPVDRRQERRPVPNEWTFVTRGWSWCSLILTTADELAAYPVGETVGNGERIIRTPAGAIFRVNDRGYKQLFESMRVFDGLGYSMTEVEQLSANAAAEQIPDDPAAPRLTAPFPDGTLVRNGSDQTVYVITDGGRRPFASSEAFQRLGYDFNRVLSIDAATFNEMDDRGSPIDVCTVTRDCVTIDPAPVGSVTVNATLDGQPWSGPVSYNVVGPSAVVIGNAVPGTTHNLAPGQYRLSFNSGGPDALASITPSDTQTLSANSTVTFTLNFGGQGGGFDEFGPNLSVTSHADGQTVTTPSVTVSGTASDAGRGESGISSVTVNGVRAGGDTASGSGAASWSRTMTLSPGANAVTVVATDDSPARNQTSETFTLNLSNGGGNGGGGVVALATGLSNPSDVATDGDYVFWTEYGSSSVKKVPVGGGAVTTLFGGLYGASGVALDSGHVYFGHGGELKKVPKDGGAVTTLASGQSVSHVAVYAGSVYWSDYNSGAIRKVSVNGGTAETIASGTPSPAGVAVSGGYVYWSEFNGPGAVRRVGVNGGAVTVVGSNSNSIGVAADGTNVLWTESVYINGGKVNRAPAGGGATTALASGLDRPHDLAVDTTSVFWVENNSNGAVKQVSLGGGTPLTLAGGLSEPVAVAADDSHVYWVERNNGGAGTGVLKKVAKGSAPPANIKVTVGTDPGGLTYKVDGVSYTGAQTFNWAPGSTHTLHVAPSQSGGAYTRYVWNGWSDGGASEHSVAPTADAAYTATYTTQHHMTLNAGAGGSVSPSSGWYNSGQSVSIRATPNSGYVFGGWAGAGAGSYTGANNPATVTMSGPVTQTASFSSLPQPSGWLSFDGWIDDLAVGRNADGRLELFVRGSDKALYVRSQSAPNSANWNSWRRLGGWIDDLAVGRNADGRLQVFVRGSDKALYYNVQAAPNSNVWTGWVRLGGWIDRLGVIGNADGRLSVFARGTDGALYHMWQTAPNSNVWSQWASLGGWLHDLAVGRNADGRLTVFARGSNNALYHRTQVTPNSNVWSQWESLGGWIDRLAVASHADGRLEVFVRGSNQALYRQSQTAPNSKAWGGWSSLGGWIDDVAASVNADGRMEVLVRGSDRAVYRRIQASAGSSNWGDWVSLGGAVEGFAVAANQDGRLEVFARGPNGVPLRRRQASAGTW